MKVGARQGNILRWFSLMIQVVRELGPTQMGMFALYRLGLRSGHFRRTVNGKLANRLEHGVKDFSFQPLWRLPQRDALEAVLGEQGKEQALTIADEIVSGKARLFGGVPLPIQLKPATPLAHWTAYESRQLVNEELLPSGDIKFVWEPARFGWAFHLGRAYLLSEDERYAQAFWQRFEEFLEANPPYQGPNWASAQEVGLRLIAWSFALQAFLSSKHTYPERIHRLLRSIAVHAGRIPPTLLYARAQNNNHLLSESAALVTAGLLLPQHPCAPRWLRVGQHGFQRGLLSQVAADGGYIQHSVNYHRLMLQLGLWMRHLSQTRGESLDEAVQARLAAATRWLTALVDALSGGAPNLGPNDGAYIFPLTIYPFSDYRPVVQAASLAFCGELAYPAGQWNEMSLWLNGDFSRNSASPSTSIWHLRLSHPTPAAPNVLRSPNGESWAYLRAARFSGRPGHADQLHLDLWLRGENIAIDAGTYLYNAPPPWDNALAGSDVHNTITVNDQHQMQRLGRFLFTGWAQAQIIESEAEDSGEWLKLVAEHNGYRRLGVIHRRQVEALPNGDWLIQDTLLPNKVHRASQPREYEATLNWLLPDAPWQAIELPNGAGFEVELEAPQGRFRLALQGRSTTPQTQSLELQIARAGRLIFGKGAVSPVWGWSSPTYGDKIPALAVRLTLRGHLPLSFSSQWLLE
jgi:hypothetical protein